MKKNKILLSMLICSLITGSVTACGSAAGNNGEPESGDGKVKLTALINKHSLTKDLDEMVWLKELEDKAGVEIEWQQISADWDQKKSAMFASGEIPDMLFNATADSDYVQYNGLFEDMTPLIEKEAPNIQMMFQNHPETEIIAKTKDGKIYGISGYQAV